MIELREQLSYATLMCLKLIAKESKTQLLITLEEKKELMKLMMIVIH